MKDVTRLQLRLRAPVMESLSGSEPERRAIRRIGHRAGAAELRAGHATDARAGGTEIAVSGHESQSAVATSTLEPSTTTHEFSCEGCGYLLVAACEGARCSECGKACAESDPERCGGSEWQSHTAIPAWFVTSWGALFAPHRMFAKLRMTRPAFGLAAINIALAGLLLTLTPDRIRSWSEVLRAPDSPASPGMAGMIAERGASFLVQSAAGMGVLAAITLVTALALWVKKRPDGGRAAPAVVMQVVAHSTAAWLIAGPIRFAVERLAHPTLELIGRETWNRWEQGHPLVVESVWRFLPLGSMWGLIAGLVLFWMRACRGLRQRRYATVIRPARRATRRRN